MEKEVKLSYYRNMLDDLKQVVKKYNVLGSITIPWDISSEYNFEQITITMIENYKFLYIIYGLSEDDYSECDIVLKEQISGYIFNYNQCEVVKIENLNVVDYKLVDIEFYYKIIRLVEKVVKEENKSLADEIYGLLDEYFKT